MCNDHDPSELLTTIRFDVPAAGESKPALKYRLFPPRFECKLGNAASLYRKAFAIAKEVEEKDSDRFESMQLFMRSEAGRKEWWGEENIPEELSPEEVNRFFEDYADFFAMIDDASYCAECDWELSTQDLSWWQTDFDDYQEPSRTTSQLLAIRACYACQHNDTELAIRSIQNLYALVENIQKMPMVVHSIFTGWIAGTASLCLYKLIASGKSPNLYWALTQLPRFSCNYRRAIESERNDPFSWYIQLKEVDNLDRDNDHEYWREFGEKFLVKIQGHVNLDLFLGVTEDVETDQEGSISEEAKEKLRQEFLEEAAADTYKNDPEGLEAYKRTLYPADPQTILVELPTIKQAILDWGYPSERVEQFCAEHLVAIYTVRVHEELFDEITKWFGLDYLTWLSFQEGEAGEQIKRVVESYDTQLAKMIAENLYSPYYFSSVNIEQGIDALRIVEAIRLYAASHEGKLPKKLDKIKEVPIPRNPMTGKPFEYQVEKTPEGPIGVLQFAYMQVQQCRYEIRILPS